MKKYGKKFKNTYKMSKMKIKEKKSKKEQKSE